MKNYRAYAIGLLALLTVSLVVAAALLLVQGNDNPGIQILPPSSESAIGVASGSPAIPSSPVEAAQLKVYVSGAVRGPGVYALHAGSRLEDALAAAGGATTEADLTAVNLAMRVRDEGYYYFPTLGETPPPVAETLSGTTLGASSSDTSKKGTGRGLLNLNTATLEELSALPGIGPVRAQAIIDHREQNGPFTSVLNITEVSGIGIGTYEKLRDLVTVGAP